MSETAEFDAFYGHARRTVLLQSLVLTGDPAQAARATVGVFEDAWGSWGRVRREDSAAWVRRRLHDRSPTSWRSDVAGAPPDPDEEQQALLSAFAALPPQQRRAWALVEIAGLSEADAAAEVGMTPQGLTDDLRAARHELRHPLGAGTGAGAASRHEAPQTPVHARNEELPGPADAADAADPEAAPEEPGDADPREDSGPESGPTATGSGAADEPWTARDIIVVLDDLARSFRLPAPPQLRTSTDRQGGGRSRTRLLRLGAAAAAVLLVAGGAYAVVTELDDGPGPAIPSGGQAAGADGQSEVPASALLGSGGLADLGRGGWTEIATTTEPGNTGPGSVCQQAGVPDPAALGVQERRFTSSSAAAQETLTVSRSPELARAAYDRLVSWWSTCTGRTVLLQGSYATDVGEQSLVLTLRNWSEPTSSYVVALAQAGAVTVSLVSVDPAAAAQSPDDQLPGTPEQAAVALGRALAAACGIDAASCGEAPTSSDGTVQRVAPPSPPGSRGLITTVDLPPPGDLSLAWAASPPISADGEIRPTDERTAFTPCDELSFGAEGASNVYTRSFEVPGDPDLPSYFGLAETVATFATEQRASEVVDAVVRQFDSCASRVPSARVASLGRDLSDQAGSSSAPVSESAVWGLGYDEEDAGRVFVRTAVVRNGRAVGRITFTPGPQNDLTREQLAIVVVRARTRLANALDGQLPS